MCSSSFALQKSQYQDLLTPLDLYFVPKEIVKPMRRNELFQMLIQRALALKIAKEDLKIATESHHLSYDNFIPKPAFSTSYTYSETFSSTNIATYAKNFSLGLAMNGATPWGFSYIIDLPKATQSISRTSGLDSQSNTFALGLNSTLNLLKGSFFLIGGIALTEADIDYQIAQHSLKSTLLQTMLQGEQAFYEVILKQIRVNVLQLALRSAKALLVDVREMIRAGESEKLSSIKVELQLAQTETDLLAAQIELSTAGQALQDIIALKEATLEDMFPDPNEIKSAPPPPGLSVNEAIVRAKKQRPDYVSVLLRLKKSRLEVEKAFSNVLPRLDLKSSYGYSKNNTSLALAASDAFKFKNPQYSVGLEFSYSFFNDSEKTAYRIAKINLLKTELTLTQLNNQIAKEVTSAVNSVEIGQRRSKTSELARGLSEKKLAAEFEKFKVGESNIRNIIDFQGEVNTARISEVNARVDFLKNLAALRNVLGEFPPGVELKP